MKKILIIEDEPDVAKTIKLYLAESGYESEYSLDAAETADMLKGYDLLLLDLRMPKFSGRAVLNDMKEKNIKKPVIVLSAVSLSMTVSDELRKKFPGTVFISKTAMYTELLPAIKKLIGK